jgi:hypothetical protein
MRKFYLLLLSFVALTLTTNAQVLLNEDFEGTFPPANWTRINAGTGNNWQASDAVFTDGPYAAFAGNKAMIYEYHATNAANAWMISPGLSMTGGTSYAITFYYRIRSATYPEKMKVTVGNAATVAAQTTTLWDNNGGASLTVASYRAATINYTPASSGTYYFGWNAYSIANEWAIQVDNIKIESTPAAPACATNASPANLATNVPYLPSIALSWNAVAGANSYDLYFSTTNPPTSLIGTYPGTSIPITGGAGNTTYYWYVVPRNGGGTAAGCSPANVTSFTTEAAPVAAPGCATLTSPANGATGIPAPEATISWNATAQTSGYDVYFGNTSTPPNLGTTTGTSVTITGLTVSTTYYWYIVPKNSIGSAAGCNANQRSFTTRAWLPVTLSDFTGERKGSVNKLAWSTATESNNSGFELQKSADGMNFSKLVFVATKAEGGNSNAALSYNFDDARPFSGTTYYRLKQVDKDGKATFSKIVSIKGDKAAQFEFSAVYPNPTRDILNIAFISPTAQKVTINVTDVTGKLVLQNSLQSVPGDNNLKLSLGSLQAGTYLIKAVCENGCETASQRIIKY